MDVEKVITEVFVRVPLWNQAHPDHHNRHVLNKLWTEIANELDTTRDAVQKKWKYLRDYFRAECVKKTKPKSGDPGKAEFVSSWPHFENMKFLLDQMTNRKSSGNLKTPSSNSPTPTRSSTTVVQFSPVHETEENDEDQTEILEPNQDFFVLTDNSEAMDETVQKEPRCILPNRKRKNQSEAIGSALINLEQQKLEYLKSKKTAKQSESSVSFDEDRNFFESILPHVKKITPEKKLLFRGEIQQLVQRYAYPYQSNDYHGFHSDSSRQTSTPESYTPTFLSL